MIECNLTSGCFLNREGAGVWVRLREGGQLRARARRLDFEEASRYHSGWGEAWEPPDWHWEHQQSTGAGKEFWLDLEPALLGEYSPYLALQLGDDENWHQRLWLDVSELALTMFTSPARRRLWGVDLRAGVALLDWGENGLLTLPRDINSGRSWGKGIAVEVRHAETVLGAFVNDKPAAAGWSREAWAVCLDRKAYQPGETIALGGWLRSRGAPGQPLQSAYCAQLSVTSANLGYHSVEFSRLGGFCLQIPIPPGCPPGQHELKLQACNPEGELFEKILSLRVGVIQYPALLWSIDASDENQLCARAQLHTGEPVAGADVEWSVERVTFRPQPARTHEHFFTMQGPEPPWPTLSLRGKTDAQGCHSLAYTPETDWLAVRFTAIVTGPDRRRWSTTRRVNFRGGRLCAGLRRQGELVSVIVCDLDGNLIAGVEVEISPGSQRVISQLQPVLVDVNAEDWVTARVRDEAGLVHSASLPPQTRPPATQASLMLEQDGYRPGEVARLWVFLPQPGGLGLLHALQGEPRVLLQASLTEQLSMLEFAVDESMVGAVELRLDVVSAAGHQVLHTQLPVSAEHHRLQVDVRPLQDAYLPDTEAEVAVRVRDAQGLPCVGAEVLLLVVDEAAEASCQSGVGDPLAALYPTQPGWLKVSSSADIVPGTLPQIVAARDQHNRALSCGGSPGFYQEPAQPLLRRHFQPLACWQRVVCDENGLARGFFRLPSQATRYQVRALACADAFRFGLGGGSLVVRPRRLTLRAVLPRFAWLNDEFEVSILVQNSGEEPLPVRLWARASGLTLPEARGWSFELTGSRELRLKVRAHQAGLTRLQLLAETGADRDGLELSLPVRQLQPRALFAWGGFLPFRLPASDLAELRLTLKTPDFAHHLTEVSGVLGPLGLALQLLVILHHGDRQQDMLAADRRVHTQRGGYWLSGAPAKLAALLAAQLPSGGFPTWDEEEAEAPVGVQRLILEALRASRADGAARRLEAYLATGPELRDDPSTREIVGQAHYWAAQREMPPGLEGLDYWLLPLGADRQPAGRSGTTARFATAGVGLERLLQAMPLLARRVQDGCVPDYYALWAGEVPPSVPPRGNVRVGEMELSLDGWLDQPLEVSWQPQGQEIFVDWRGQGRVAFELRGVGPAVPGPLRVRCSFSGARREGDRWFVNLGCELVMSVSVQGNSQHFEGMLPYPGGCDVLDAPQDLGGVVPVKVAYRDKVELRLRALRPGIFRLPPAWVWGPMGAHGMSGYDVLVISGG